MNGLGVGMIWSGGLVEYFVRWIGGRGSPSPFIPHFLSRPKLARSRNTCFFSALLCSALSLTSSLRSSSLLYHTYDSLDILSTVYL